MAKGSKGGWQGPKPGLQYPREASLAEYAEANPGSPKIAWWRDIVLPTYARLVTEGNPPKFRPQIIESRYNWGFKVPTECDPELWGPTGAEIVPIGTATTHPLALVDAVQTAEEVAAADGDPVGSFDGVNLNDFLRRRQVRNN